MKELVGLDAPNEAGNGLVLVKVAFKAADSNEVEARSVRIVVWVVVEVVDSATEVEELTDGEREFGRRLVVVVAAWTTTEEDEKEVEVEAMAVVV